MMRFIRELTPAVDVAATAGGRRGEGRGRNQWACSIADGGHVPMRCPSHSRGGCTLARWVCGRIRRRALVLVLIGVALTAQGRADAEDPRRFGGNFPLVFTGRPIHAAAGFWRVRRAKTPMGTGATRNRVRSARMVDCGPAAAGAPASGRCSEGHRGSPCCRPERPVRGCRGARHREPHRLWVRHKRRTSAPGARIPRTPIQRASTIRCLISLGQDPGSCMCATRDARGR